MSFTTTPDDPEPPLVIPELIIMVYCLLLRLILKFGEFLPEDDVWQLAELFR